MKISKYNTLNELLKAVYVDSNSIYARNFSNEIETGKVVIKTRENNTFLLAVKINNKYYAKTVRQSKKPNTEYFLKQIKIGA